MHQIGKRPAGPLAFDFQRTFARIPPQQGERPPVQARPSLRCRALREPAGVFPTPPIDHPGQPSLTAPVAPESGAEPPGSGPPTPEKLAPRAALHAGRLTPPDSGDPDPRAPPTHAARCAVDRWPRAGTTCPGRCSSRPGPWSAVGERRGDRGGGGAAGAKAACSSAGTGGGGSVPATLEAPPPAPSVSALAGWQPLAAGVPIVSRQAKSSSTWGRAVMSVALAATGTGPQVSPLWPAPARTPGTAFTGVVWRQGCRRGVPAR